MTDLPKVIRENGKIATLRVSRKQHNCSECPLKIAKGEPYYEVIMAGSGLGNLKFPDRAHPGCLDRTLRR